MTTTNAAGFLNQKKLRLLVWSRDAANTVSASAPTAWFDTQYAAAAVPTDAVPLADQSLHITWRTSTAVEDITPNDPLDLPSGVTLSTLRWATTAEEPTETLPVAAGSTSTTIPKRPLPYRVLIQATNEWGKAAPAVPPLTFASMTAGLKMAAVAPYKTSVSIEMLQGLQACLPPDECGYSTDGSVVSWLQSRADATQPWKTIGIYSGWGPTFHTKVISYGGTEFRSYIPAHKQMAGGSPVLVSSASSTSARYSATSANYLKAWFKQPVVLVGQVVETELQVNPPIGGNASLQYWDGTAWKHSAYIPLTNGVGKLTFKAAGRGTTKTFRISLPKLIWLGKPIVATNSAAFTLQVR